MALALCLTSLVFFVASTLMRQNERICIALATAGCSLLVALVFVLLI